MAAGLGFKDFTTGEVLTAADVDGYLMQGVWVFANAAARDAAVTSPQEGNFAYLKDTNVTTYYTGSAWANLDTTGMTNPMTTTGDIIYSSPGSTPVRLGIGSTGDVLTVASGVPSWAAPAGGASFSGVLLNNSSGTQSISNATNTAITWDLETFDTNAYHSTVTNTSRITIPAGKAGYYQFGAQLQADNNTTGDRRIRLHKNGTGFMVSAFKANDQYPLPAVTTIVNLAVGDYVEVFYFQNSTGSQNVIVAAPDAQFYAYYLGA
jgi:hypothetical protein